MSYVTLAACEVQSVLCLTVVDWTTGIRSPTGTQFFFHEDWMHWSLLWLSAMLIIKMAVFWDVAPCSLVDIDRRFRDAYCLPWWWRHWAPLKCRWVSTRLHVVTSQKSAVFIRSTVRTWNLICVSDVSGINNGDGQFRKLWKFTPQLNAEDFITVYLECWTLLYTEALSCYLSVHKKSFFRHFFKTEDLPRRVRLPRDRGSCRARVRGVSSFLRRDIL
jgi:hypothetical protein